MQSHLQRNTETTQNYALLEEYQLKITQHKTFFKSMEIGPWHRVLVRD